MQEGYLVETLGEKARDLTEGIAREESEQFRIDARLLPQLTQNDGMLKDAGDTLRNTVRDLGEGYWKREYTTAGSPRFQLLHRLART